jgi:hypothetical protein
MVLVRFVGQGVLLFGLALVTGGVGVLVTFRDALGIRRLARPSHPTTLRSWVVRAWMRTRPSGSGPRAVGRACPPRSCLLRED